ncbi:MAG TPA: AmmeMemoRadiSam system protein A [Desulfotomaculum sp.]|nr:AmmeMemoRadiSam system protein A [Desulfotomaculum sp.]
MSIVYGGICPHPPIMVPEVGGAEADKVISSRRAVLELGRRVKESGAEALVLISPHGPVFRDGIAVTAVPAVEGDLGRFGASRVRFKVQNHLPLVEEIKGRAAELGVTVLPLDAKTARRYGLDLELDHGTMVPLYFLREAGLDLPLVPVAMGLLPYPRLYAFGAALARAAQNVGLKVAVLASGDMSHRLTPGAPAGFDPRGKEFDREMARLVGAADIQGIMNLDAALVDGAGECGLRPVIITFGAFDGLAVRAEVLSYEGPFGVGYMVAALAPAGPDPRRRLLEKLTGEEKKAAKERINKESFLVRVARRSLENYFAGRSRLYDDTEIPPEFARRAGAFVSLHKYGQLRGCIGTVTPRYEHVVEEVARNAVSAAVRDPRFYPVTEDELPDLEISVDVLAEPEPVDGLDKLDPKKYGVIVQSGRRQGLLLPDLEGVDTVERQVDIARQKAGIGPHEPVQLYRFEVKRYH